MGDASRTDELELILWIVSTDFSPNVLIVRPSGDSGAAEANGFISATCGDMQHMCEYDAEKTEATKEHLEYVHDWNGTELRKCPFILAHLAQSVPELTIQHQLCRL